MKLRMAFLVAALAISTTAALGAGKSQTFTGEVSDSMCGAKHMMQGKPGECARACVGKGSSYALVVGDKVYSLQTQDKAAQDDLRHGIRIPDIYEYLVGIKEVINCDCVET